MKSVLLRIMSSALKSIESLEHFYLTEYETIAEKSEKGRRKYCLGWVIDVFFSVLTYANDSEKRTKEYKELEQKVKKEITFKLLPKKDPDSQTIRFRYKNRLRLEKLGVELDVEKSAEEFVKYVDMPRIHGSNTLIMLVTRFEEFISRLMAEIYTRYPRRYLDNENVRFAEIEGRGFSEIKEGVVDRLVSAMMRERYSKWFELFAGHGLDAHAWAIPLEGLREVYARRNIIVHNAGIVNREYLAQVPHSKHKKGVKLDVGKEYVDKAFMLVREMIFMLMLEATHFLRNEDVNSYLYTIFEESFERLAMGDHSLCMLVFDWLRKAKEFDENMRSMAQVNYWLAKIGAGDFNEETRNEIIKFDVSAMDESFKIAKFLLLQDYDEATKLLEHQLSIGEMSASMVMKWPLFEGYRRTKFFERLRKRNKAMFKDYDIRPTRTKNDKDCIEKANAIRATCHGRGSRGRKCVRS